MRMVFLVPKYIFRPLLQEMRQACRQRSILHNGICLGLLESTCEPVHLLYNYTKY